MSLRKGEALIPTDVLEEILHRLPSNDLLKFKIVCKDWLHLISSPEFIQKHLERSKVDCNGALVLAINKITTDFEMIYMEENITKKIPLPGVKSFLGSCDGLVLCRLSDCTIAAVNPSTGEYAVRTLNPSIHSEIINTRYDELISSWFGRHPCTGEYVLVIANLLTFGGCERIMFKECSLSCDNQNPVLSSSTGPLSYLSYTSFGNIGTFLHKKLHCPFGLRTLIGSTFEIVILVYNFQENGKIETISCPVKSCPTLGVVDGYLSIVCIREEVYELWVMKEYGVKESWIRYTNIEGYEINSDGVLSLLIPLEFFPNGDYGILNGERSWIAKFRLRLNGVDKLIFDRRCSLDAIACVCIDSLVSPDSLSWGETEEIPAD